MLPWMTLNISDVKLPVLGEENITLKIHLKYGGTFTKQCMHVSSRNMFPTTRTLQSVCMFFVLAIIVETN
jgi:hypothetical protein